MESKRPRDDRVPPAKRRSPGDYEQALRRRELAVGRSLGQALPTDRPPGTRELNDARRVLARALRELRQLRRDLDGDVHHARGGQQRRLEAAGDAIDEVLARWEHRHDQLTTAIERRPRRR